MACCINIVCIQQTMWTGAKARDTGKGDKMFYNGGRVNLNGFGVIVNQWLHDMVVVVTLISDQLISIKHQAGQKTLWMVSCLAPQTGCLDAEKDDIWVSINAYLQLVGLDEHLPISEDFKGYVRYPQHRSGESFGSHKEGGARIRDCKEAHTLAIVNTFQKRQSHLITYISGRVATQIKYWLIHHQDLKLALDI